MASQHKKIHLSVEAAKALEEQKKKESEKAPQKGSFLKKLFSKKEQR